MPNIYQIVQNLEDILHNCVDVLQQPSNTIMVIFEQHSIATSRATVSQLRSPISMEFSV